MSFKFELNSEFVDFREFLLGIRDKFSNGKTIHKARNEVKILEFKKQNFVVKSFKKPNLFKKLLYFFGKDSKAKRAYKNSLKIRNFTPEALGYIEFYKNGLINSSFFISKNFDYSFTIREILTDPNFKNRDEILKHFTKFSFELHENGVLHLDYSPGNILVKEENLNFKFMVVDINRMKFKTLSQNERLKSFSMLWLSDEDALFIAREYASLAGYDTEICSKKMLKFSHALKRRKNFKKSLKQKLRGQNGAN